VPTFILARWFFWWFFTPSYKRTSAVEIEAPRGGPKPPPIIKDDFRKLKGIGPKTSDTLHEAGILTYEQLGLMKKDQLIQVLKSINLPTAQVDFWQKQAKLAAVEDWKKLEVLKNS
jgi:predicted flap endonuclease-1-like 5' DNA nuclease